MKFIKPLLTAISVTAVLTTLTMCAPSEKETNPFFIESDAPHGTFRFDLLENEHFKPALLEGIKLREAEIEEICNNTEAPTFENTIVALDRTGSLLNRVVSTFYPIDGAETNDTLQALAPEFSSLLTEHSNKVILNEKLFERIQTVYEQRNKLTLNPEQARLLQTTYEGFANNGAALPAEKKTRFKEISNELSQLSVAFGQNSLNETNNYSHIVTNKDELKGLTEDFIAEAANKAKEAGKEGYLLDLRSTSYIPVLTYADNRELRRTIWMAYNTQCLEGSKYSNIDNIKKIINLKLELAQLFGYKNYAEFALRDRMAKDPSKVYALLDQLQVSFADAAKDELEELQKFAFETDKIDAIQPWDHSYYSDKLRTKKFSLNDEMLKPYFELESITKGVFGLSETLFGLKFTENKDIPVYHKEVKAYDVTDLNNNFVAVLYTDFHPRPGKRSGAWMTEFKGQWKESDGTDSRPHITIVMNFTRPTETKPALLTFGEVTTFLHEFGHALHGMLTDCTYASLSGTNVYRDFVELPSQLLENWATETDWLNQYAVHYETGEKIPAEYVTNIINSSNFNTGYGCYRQLSFGYQDLAFHTITEPFNGDVLEMENNSTLKANILPYIEGTGRSATFGHIFSGGYAAGYYSYKWAEVLDADAFSMFKQNGIFDKTTADSFNNNILKRGNTEDPMDLYVKFRGQEPTVDALLERSGIKK